MLFSVLIKATGNLDNVFHPCDITLAGIIRCCQSIEYPDWHPDDSASEPGDSEYEYLSRECGPSIPDVLRTALLEADGASKERIANRIRERYGAAGWWATTSNYQASGILPRVLLTELMEGIGAYATDTETLGTLGGPADPIGIAPDIDFEVESSAVIVCVRVTPLPDVSPREGRWERVRDAVVRVYGY
jgi:hypothetical protein